MVKKAVLPHALTGKRSPTVANGKDDDSGSVCEADMTVPLHKKNIVNDQVLGMNLARSNLKLWVAMRFVSNRKCERRLRVNSNVSTVILSLSFC